MIAGTVSAEREAVIPLIVRGVGAREQAIDVVVDTGFTGSLTLPGRRDRFSGDRHGRLKLFSRPSWPSQNLDEKRMADFRSRPQTSNPGLLPEAES